MKYYKLGRPLLAVAIGFAAVLFLIGLIDVSSTPAQGGQTINYFGGHFIDESNIPILDLSGNPIGEGVHTGTVRCNFSVCSQKTELILFDTQYMYQFQDSQLVDDVDRRVILSGKGWLSGLDYKERFQFVSIIQDNRDGTLSVRYEASIPEASFLIPSISGRMTFGR